VRYVLIGEAPGQSEVEQCTPFVGPPGHLLRECAAAADIDLQHQAVITNCVLCPPRISKGEMINTAASLEEAKACIPHALSLLTVLPTPPVVIGIGGTVYKTLSGNARASIVRDRGQWFKLSIDEPTRYQVFRLWLRQPFVQSRIAEIDQSSGLQRASQFLGSLLNPEHQEESCLNQIEYAKEHLGYDESWMDVDCMPVVSPAFILKQGRYGQQYENMKLDFTKARMRVTGETYVKSEKDYAWLETAQDFSDFVDEAIALHESGELKVMGGDIETEFSKTNKIGLLSYDPSIDIVSLQFSLRDDHGRAVLLQHPLSKNNDPVSMRMIVADLKRLLKAVPSAWQNGTFDFNTLRCRLGVTEWNMSGDTLLMEHWINAGKGLLYNLDDMGARRVGTGKHKQAAKAWLKNNPGKEFKDMPLDIALDYGCGDTDVTLQIYWQIRKEMEREFPVKGDPTTMWEFYQRHFYEENQGWRVIADLEYYGMKVDKEILDMLNTEYPKRIDEAHKAIMAIPRMQELWTHADYKVYRDELVRLNSEISIEHSQGKKRRRLHKIKPYEEWAEDKKNWFNPNSNSQTLRLWRDILKLKFGVCEATGQPYYTDLEYSDEKCPKCGRDLCKCPKGKKHIPVVPKATDHNREIILDTVKQIKNSIPDPSPYSPDAMQRMEDVISVVSGQSRFKKLSKLFGTYVKGIYPLIPDKPDEGDPWDASERCNPLYKPFCSWPEPWSIHPQYRMNGTETGRLASADPNGQNFPCKGDDAQTNVKLPYISRWDRKGGILLQPDYCLTGDTEISLLDGTEVPIKDLVGRDEFWVYSCTPEGRVVPGRGHSARLTKKNTEIVKVTLDNGEEIRCTPNHPFMLKCGEYRRADELSSGDSLMPMRKWILPSGYEIVQHPSGGRQSTHAMVAYHEEKNSVGNVVHHKNFNKRDNRPENLQVMLREDHAQYHALMAEHLKYWRPINGRRTGATNLTKYNKSEEHRKTASETQKRYAPERMKKMWEENEEFRKKATAAASENMKNMHEDKSSGLNTKWVGTKRQKDYLSARMKSSSGMIVSKLDKIATVMLNSGLDPKNWDSSLNILQSHGMYKRAPREKAVLKWAPHIIDGGNHKVISVVSSSREDVYDITVDDYHNFALESGIFVHNSQIEVRVMVVECGDEKLTEALNAGKDIHRFVSSIVHGILEEEVTADIRKPCKTVTFGILYGQTVKALAQALHISVEEGQALVDKFFEQFPRVKQLVEGQHATVKEFNRVTTRMGRIRWLYHVKSANKGESNKALRDCVNTPIQSMASDLCWQAMGRVWQEICRRRWLCYPFSIIHDSQTFDVGPGYVMDLIEMQYYQMVYRTQEIYPWMVVKPEADFSIGTCWGNLIDIDLQFDASGQIDHNRLAFAGPKADVDLVCEQFELGGLKLAVADGIDGPHPQKEEAEKGKWYRKVFVERPNPRALLRGRTLEFMST